MTPLRTAGIVLLLCASAALASPRGTVRVLPGAARGWLRVSSVEAPLSRVLSAITMRTGRPIRLDARDRLVTLDFTAKSTGELLARIAREEGLSAELRGDGWELRESSEATVTMNVMDAELGEILSIVRKQCGIRNVIVDPGVTASGTFMFTDVPCTTAIRTIFATLGLAAEMHPSSLMRVKR